jgi:hypothetical protein
MKKLLWILLLVLVACETPVSESKNTDDPVIDNDGYRFLYEFKNDRNKDVTLVFCREYETIRSVNDSKGKGFTLDSTLSTFESVEVPMDSIVTIGSNKDTLIVSPQYLLDIVPDRFRAIEYGHGMKWLSESVYE